MRLRNALIPIVTVIGLQVGVLFTGAILTETIFSWPGVGNWLIEGDQPARLSGAAGRHAADRRHHHDGQSAGRRHLRRDQPAHPAQPMSSASPRCADSPRRPAAAASAARILADFSRNRGAVAGLDHRLRAAAHRRDGQRHRALFADPHQRRGFLKPPFWQAGGSLAAPARHRRHRPRHPFAPHLRRAAVAADRHRRRRAVDR